mgnify:CR=1 FL=1
MDGLHLVWLAEMDTKNVVQQLLNCLDRNIKLNARDEDGWIAFMIACYRGHKGVVQMLLNCPENNIELNARDLDGWTAFMIVCQRGHKAVVQLDHSYSNTTKDLQHL